jgi:hypothetical protein
MFRFLFKMTLHVAVVAIVIAVASQMGLFRYVHLPFDLPSVNVSALASPLLGCHCARHESLHFGRNEEPDGHGTFCASFPACEGKQMFGTTMECH